MRTHYSKQVTPDLAGEKVTLCGWAHESRDMGKIKFLILRDREGVIQVLGKKGETKEEMLSAIDSISRESVVKVTGIVKASKMAPGGVEVLPESIEVISEALSPLPLDVTGKVPADLDTRLNMRFMDIRKPEITAIFRIKDKILTAGRKYFEEQDDEFIEIHSPKIIASASEGGTELFPVAYFDKEAFLAQSPQLYKQMMMATGFDRVYEVTNYFRAEEHDTFRHLNEVTAFDSEQAFINDENDVMQTVEGLARAMLTCAAGCENEIEIINNYYRRRKIKDKNGQTKKLEINAPEKNFRKITYDEALDLLSMEGKELPWGEDLDTESEKILGKIIKEKFKDDIYFITKYPLKIKPFYTMPGKGLEDECADDSYSRAFDLEYRGVEVVSGSQRIHDYNLLSRRLEYHNLNPENFKSYLNSFRYGMPPHGGFGLGIDRILMQMFEVNVREVVLFPRDRHRLTP